MILYTRPQEAKKPNLKCWVLKMGNESILEAIDVYDGDTLDINTPTACIHDLSLSPDLEDAKNASILYVEISYAGQVIDQVVLLEDRSDLIAKCFEHKEKELK